jgi:hypothetical protein
MVSERCSGRFGGYRVNCESVPCLPAHIVADCLADPRGIPYLLIWTRRPLPVERGSSAAVLLAEPQEAVRLSPVYSGQEKPPRAGSVENMICIRDGVICEPTTRSTVPNGLS